MPARNQLLQWLVLIAIAVAVGLGIDAMTTASAPDGVASDEPAAPTSPSRGAEEETTLEVSNPEPAAGPSSAEPSSAEPSSAGPSGTPEAGRGQEDPGESAPAASPEAGTLEPLVFEEIWAYLMPGEAERWRTGSPLTDLCLFSHSVDEVGEISGRLDDSLLERARREGVRTHVVLACQGRGSALHFLLRPDLGLREGFVERIVELATRHEVDGFQLDFEGFRSEERAAFVSLVRDLRARLPAERVFSICLPAKTGPTPHAFYYEDLATLCDRSFLMVYDLHWGGGPPGPVSELSWHDRVIAHAKSRIPLDRIVVGLPFYGRRWQHEKLARATRFQDLTDLLARDEVTLERDDTKGHRYTYEERVRVEGWFDDAASLHRKLRSARDAGVTRIGFWRLGQEDPAIWNLLRRATDAR